MHFSTALRPVRPRALFESSVSSKVFSPGHHSELSQDPEDLRQLLCQNRNNGRGVIIGRHTHAALLNALAVSAVGRQAPWATPSFSFFFFRMCRFTVTVFSMLAAREAF